jgi:hypothetical protein
VGITRARRRLFISFCRYRFNLGSKEYRYESRFIKELPRELIKTHDISDSERVKNLIGSSNPNSFLGNKRKGNSSFFYKKGKY